MAEQPLDEQLITDYLLGALPETEIERLDEMSLTDDDFAGRLSAMENDLVDTYVRGELTGNTLARFKSHYLASSRRREKVSFAETFRDMVDRPSIAQTEESALKTESRKPQFFAIPRPSLQWVFAAAALVMLLAGGYLMFENIRLRKQIAQTQAEHTGLKQREQELRQKLAQQQSSDTETENELARVRERLAQLEQQLADIGGSQQPEQSDVKVIAFNLSPQTRGVSKIPSLVIPAETDSVALTLELEPNDFSAYLVALKNPATDEVLWRSDTLKASGSGNQVHVRLPASLLKPQNYVLELSGISAGGVGEIVSSYPFRVKTE